MKSVWCEEAESRSAGRNLLPVTSGFIFYLFMFTLNVRDRQTRKVREGQKDRLEDRERESEREM